MLQFNKTSAIFLILTFCSVLCESLSSFSDIKEFMFNIVDSNVDPCTDFYSYACGNWKKYTKKLNYSESDNLQIIKAKVTKYLTDILADINESTNKNQYKASNKVKYYFASCLHAGELKDDGIRFFSEKLLEIGDFPILNSNWTDESFDWVNITSSLRLYGVQALIQESVGPNWNNSSQQVIYLTTPKFKFVTKNDLTGSSRNSEEYVFLYKRYIKQLLLKLGLRIRKAKEITEEIVDFEMEIAKIIPPEEDISPPETISLNDLNNKISQINWFKYLSKILGSKKNLDYPIIIQEEYYKKLVTLIARTEAKTIANYLLFKFFSHFEVGVENKLTSEHCSQEINNKLGVITGALFAQKILKNETQYDVVNLVRNLKETFQDMINNTTWMDASTKALGVQKLQAMSTIVGLPENILPQFNLNRHFIELQISSDNYYQNKLNIERFNTKNEHNSLFIAENTVKWKLNPSDVNAFYKITKNLIFIPAGLLLPPIYDITYPQYHRYAVLGSIISHEIIHGFDFEGRNYDAKGNVYNWWSTRSYINYFSHLECILSQYNNYSSIDKRSSGLSFSENVADNGGVRLAFNAFKKLLDSPEKSAELDRDIRGTNMTSLQLFFLSFAQLWCGENTSLQDHSRHSPHKYRVIGTLSNMPEFSDEFNCGIGSEMRPTRRCNFW